MNTSADAQRHPVTRSADRSTRAGRLHLVAPGDTATDVDRLLDEEHDLQGHALSLESHCLRRRAERYVEVLRCGGDVGAERVTEVTRAFRAYRPFVFEHDRRLNDAARRGLARAVAARSQGSDGADASVA